MNASIEDATLPTTHARSAGAPGTGDAAGRYDVIVIGGGQSGLSAGYHLKQQGLSFVILDAARRVGDAWRQRWDSLRLFTPARFDGLDGMPFPAPANHFPTKDEMADYLEAYAAYFALPVVSAVRVMRLSKAGESFVVETNGRRFEARQVVVAMSKYQKPFVPEFAGMIDPLGRLSQSGPARRRRRPAGWRGQLGGGDRPRPRAGPAGLRLRPSSGARAHAYRQRGRA